MKKAIHFTIILLFPLFTSAQEVVTEHTLKIKLDYTPGLDKKITHQFNDTQRITIKLDTPGFRAARKALHDIKYKDSASSRPVTEPLDQLQFSSTINGNFSIYITVADTVTSATSRAGDTTKYTTIELAFIKEKPKTEIERKVEALTERVSSLFLETPSNRPIGEFVFTNGKVYIKESQLIPNAKGKKRWTPVIVDSTTVDKLAIGIRNSAIGRRQLKVYTSDGKSFFNKNAPVSLAKIFKRKADRLYLFDARKKVFIELGDVLDYQNFAAFNYPSDTQKDIILTTKEQRDTLKVGSTINQLIDVCIYTDLLGLLGRTPNSILQTEISGNFISNTTNKFNRDLVFHSFVKPYIRVSKFDSRFAQLKPSDFLDTFVSSTNPRDSINRTYLNQISYLQGGIKMNVLRWGLGTNQEISLNLGADINLVNADSLYKTDITFINWYPEFQYRISRLSNFGMELSARFNWQKVTEAAPFTNKGEQVVLQSQASLYYYPFSNLDNRVFFRFNYFDNLSESRYNFSQFQIGWKTSLFSGNNKTAIK